MSAFSEPAQRHVILPLLAAGFVLVAATAGAQETKSQLKGLQLSNDKPIQIQSDKLEIQQQSNTAQTYAPFAVSAASQSRSSLSTMALGTCWGNPAHRPASAGRNSSSSPSGSGRFGSASGCWPPYRLWPLSRCPAAVVIAGARPKP